MNRTMAVLPAASAPSTKSSKLAAVRGVVPSASALPAFAAPMQANARMARRAISVPNDARAPGSQPEKPRERCGASGLHKTLVSREIDKGRFEGVVRGLRPQESGVGEPSGRPKLPKCQLCTERALPFFEPRSASFDQLATAKSAKDHLNTQQHAAVENRACALRKAALFIGHRSKRAPRAATAQREAHSTLTAAQ